MIAVAKSADVMLAAREAQASVRRDIEADHAVLKELYDRRFASEEANKAWEATRLLRDKAVAIEHRLQKLQAQCAALPDAQITLDAAEFALLAYARD